MQYVIYVALILLGLAFPKKKSVAYGMLLFIWVLFVFNRGNADFAHYKEIYYDMATITTLVYRGVEAGWLTLCAISRDVFHLEYEVFIAIIGTVSLIFMVSTIKRYTEQMALVLALFMICPLLIDVVQIRFFFVTSVLFWGFRFVEKKSLKGDALFCALILVCSLIHSSALLLLLVIPMRYFGLTFQKILLAAWCVLGPLMIQPMCDLFARISGKYLHYTLTSTSWLTRGCSFVLFVGILLVTNLAYLAVKRSPSGDAGGVQLRKGKGDPVRFLRFATVFSIALCLLWPVCFINTEIVRVPRNSLVICFLCVAVMSEQNVQPQLRRLMKLFAVALACAGFWYWQVFGRSAERVLYPVMEENLVFGSPFWMCVLALTEFTVAAFAIGSACGHNTMYAYYRQMKGSAPK